MPLSFKIYLLAAMWKNEYLLSSTSIANFCTLAGYFLRFHGSDSSSYRLRQIEVAIEKALCLRFCTVDSQIAHHRKDYNLCFSFDIFGIQVSWYCERETPEYSRAIRYSLISLYRVFGWMLVYTQSPTLNMFCVNSVNLYTEHHTFTYIEITGTALR